MNRLQNIKQKAIELGFDLVGITDASPINTEQVELLADWLACGFAGRMSYMHRNLGKRINPAELLKNAQSVICVGLNYTPASHQKIPDATAPIGKVANYARYQDYHLFIKKQLRKLTVFISSLVGAGLKFKICVDSAPLSERSLAARAGLGFIAKNHMLVNPKLGPQILLGEIITNLKLKTDKPITANCSNCDKCIVACPTGALRADGRFDANKCISYLTAEYGERIPPDLAQKIGDRLFGCDECVLICPHQKDAPVCKNKQFKFYNDRAGLSLRRILDMSPADFETEFANSCFKRLGLERLQANARICLANTTNLSCHCCADKGR